jgi:hypothetical protein
MLKGREREQWSFDNMLDLWMGEGYEVDPNCGWDCGFRGESSDR